MAEASPSSDERFWGRLRDHVDDILASRNAAAPLEGCADRGKRRRADDSVLLIRGIDSVAASLSRLTDTLSAAQKGVNALAACPRIRPAEDETAGSEQGDEMHKAKRRRSGSAEEHSDGEGRETEAEAAAPENGETSASSEVMKSAHLRKARNLAMSMATRATSLAKELKRIKSELHFVQERCAMLEEENQRLREGMEKGAAREEDDDLVRLQVEALLSEKARLAQENANLARENQGLLQLVEYHQLTAQELSETESYDDAVPGMCLDFSSPAGRLGREEEDDGGSENGGDSQCCGAFATPTDKLEMLSSSTS